MELILICGLRGLRFGTTAVVPGRTLFQVVWKAGMFGSDVREKSSIDTVDALFVADTSGGFGGPRRGGSS
jgi:hypothetical protein